MGKGRGEFRLQSKGRSALNGPGLGCWFFLEVVSKAWVVKSRDHLDISVESMTKRS